LRDDSRRDDGRREARESAHATRYGQREDVVLARIGLPVVGVECHQYGINHVLVVEPDRTHQYRGIGVAGDADVLDTDTALRIQAGVARAVAEVQQTGQCRIRRPPAICWRA
jgi:hypothetical protein